MKKSEFNLQLAIKKFEEICFDLIIEKELNLVLKRAIYRLLDATIIYIQYNNYGEYSYSIFFSTLEHDFCRFDNYDQNWVVSSKPHHFHPRKDDNIKESPMNGNPLTDMIELCKFIRSCV